MKTQIGMSCTEEAGLFLFINGFFGSTIVGRAPRFHFNKYYPSEFSRNNVYVHMSGMPILCKQMPAMEEKVTNGIFFTSAT